jgi:hypothetical protein
MYSAAFEYIEPTSEQLEKVDRIRSASKGYCQVLEEVIPEGPDKTYLIRKLREIAMWANVAITRQPDGSSRKT